MSLDISHEDVRAALAAEALDALDGEERARVHAHLAGCAECRRELEALRAAAASLAHAAPPRPMEPARSARLRARLVARAAADHDAAGGDGVAADGLGARGADDDVTLVRPAAPPVDDTTVIAAPRPAASPMASDPAVIPIDRGRRSGARFGAGWLAAAASLVLFVATAAYAWTLRGRYEALAARVAELEEHRGSLARSLADRDQRLAAVSDPGVQVIDLASNDIRAPSGRMFWNVATHRWTFFAHNLPALRPGRDYQLWLVTPEGPVGAGTFKSDRAGHAMVEATYDLPPERLRAIAVTEEPEGGLPKPSGTPLIVGTYGSSE